MATLKQYADLIVQHSKPDGAIVMWDFSQAPFSVVPYFANLAVIGLMDAYGVTRDEQYLKVAKNWLSWYISHTAPDGIITNFHGSPGNWSPDTNPPYDSVDGYIATFLSAVDAVSPYFSNDSALIQQISAFCPVALNLLSKVLQASGKTANLAVNLITTTPDRPPACETEDNCEVWTGLRAAASLGWTIPALIPALQSPKTLDAINAVLFNGQASPFPRFRVGVAPDGTALEESAFMSNYSPSQQAQLLAISQLPWSETLQRLYDDMKTNLYPLVPHAIDSDLNSFDRVVWWGLASLSMEDVHATILSEIARRLISYDPGVGPWIHDLGHACAFLARYK